jgi:hypothetical protein
MLATDAKEFTFVDLTTISYHEFDQALGALRSRDPFVGEDVECRLQESQAFVFMELKNGGSVSTYSDGKHKMNELALKFLFALRGIGVDLDKVVLTPYQKGTEVRVDFPWQYHGASSSRNRSVTFVTADITNPDAYSASLKAKLEKGFDIFYMKASFFVPQYYPQFLPRIAKSLKIGGWLMTADKTVLMEEVIPDVCLKQNGLIFELQKSEEVKILEDHTSLPFDPLGHISTLDHYPSDKRHWRKVGVDLTYWSILNLRKKLSHTI